MDKYYVFVLVVLEYMHIRFKSGNLFNIFPSMPHLAKKRGGRILMKLKT